VIDTFMDPHDPQRPTDPKSVPAAIRPLLDAMKTGEALRDAEDKHVQNGQLTVRDIYAQLPANYLDQPPPPEPDPHATTPASESTTDNDHSDHAAAPGS